MWRHTSSSGSGPTVPNIDRTRMGKPTTPPSVEQAAAREWSLGWWAGNAVGVVNGVALAVLAGWLR